MGYQDTWMRGRRRAAGTRDCAGRYDAIARQLAGRSGFTVLDLGAHAGYFSLRLAEQFDARVTAVDDWPGLSRAVAGEPRVTAVPRRLTPGQVRGLGPFDVVLALSVLHHIPDWPGMLDALREAAGVLMIETPDPAEVLPKAVAHGPELAAAVYALPGEVIAWTPGHRSRILRPLKAVRP